MFDFVEEQMVKTLISTALEVIEKEVKTYWKDTIKCDTSSSVGNRGWCNVSNVSNVPEKLPLLVLLLDAINTDRFNPDRPKIQYNRLDSLYTQNIELSKNKENTKKQKYLRK